MKLLLITILCMALSAPAWAEDFIKAYVPNAQPMGQDRYTYIFWDVYDAKLWTPGGVYDEVQPFALQLSYLREFTGAKIAERTVKEMRGQGFTDDALLAKWEAQMAAIFPDVRDGVTLTGIRTKDGRTIYFDGDQKIGEIRDPEFTHHFFNVWLGERTSAPRLREALLNR